MRIYPELTQDEEFEALRASGFTGSLNDMQFAQLGALGLTGSLADRFGSWDGSIGEPIPGGTITPTSIVVQESVAFSETFVAAGGVGPYTYSVNSGSVPSGLSLSSGGVLSGTPTGSEGDPYSFTVRAVDSESNYVDQAISGTIQASFDPSTLDLIGWWDMSDDQYLYQANNLTNPVTANGQSVRSVFDQSTEANYLVDDGTPYPTWDTGGFCSFNSKYLSPNTNLQNFAAMIIVGRYDASSSNSDALCGNGGGRESFRTNGSFHQFVGDSTILSSVPDTQMAILIATNSGSNIDFYIDGTLIGTDSGANFASSNFRIGGQGGGSSASLDGDVAEAMVSSTALTTQEISDLTTYLKNKHGIA